MCVPSGSKCEQQCKYEQQCKCDLTGSSRSRLFLPLINSSDTHTCCTVDMYGMYVCMLYACYGRQTLLKCEAPILCTNVALVRCSGSSYSLQKVQPASRNFWALTVLAACVLAPDLLAPDVPSSGFGSKQCRLAARQQIQ